MKNNSKTLLGSLIILIAISTICFASGIPAPKLIKNGNTNSQIYSFAKQPFDSIRLAGNIEITAQVTHQPHTENVTIFNQDNSLSHLKIYVKNKILYIIDNTSDDDDWDFHFSKKLKKTKISVNVSELESIETKRSCNCYIDNIKASNFTAMINGSGKIMLRGIAKNLDMKIHGSGDISAENLMAENTKASINGSGHIITNTKQEINIKINGSGKVDYYGNPQKIEQSINGSGKINKM